MPPRLAAPARGLAGPSASAAVATMADAPSTTSRRRIRWPRGSFVASWGMDFEQFCSTSRVVIVAGKGGVGKTTVTAALAAAATRSGLDTLIVEVEGKSGLAASFDQPPLTY